MTQPVPDKMRLVLCQAQGSGQIVVDMEAFFEFTFDLADDLQQLEQRFAGWRRPRSGQGPLPSRRQLPG